MFNRSWIRLALAILPMTLFAPACSSSDDNANNPAKDAAGDVQTGTPDAGAGPDVASHTDLASANPDVGSQGSDTAPTGTNDAAAADTAVASDTGTATDTNSAPDTGTINCNALALVNSAPEIEGVRVAETRPAPTGGTLVPGLYYYTASRNYTGPGGATGGVNSFFKQTVKIDSLGGGKFAVELVDTERGDHTDRRAAGTVTVAGTQLNYQITCPGMMAISVGFEADATSYKTWNATDNKIHVYTKQP